jgi:hypothetical protein
MRIATRSLMAFRQGDDGKGADPDPGLHQVIDSMIPHHRPRLRATECTRILNCSSTHVICLIADGALSGLSGAFRGPNGSPQVLRESLTGFLAQRRVL